jgi:hypothetical protein
MFARHLIIIWVEAEFTNKSEMVLGLPSFWRVRKKEFEVLE